MEPEYVFFACSLGTEKPLNGIAFRGFRYAEAVLT